MAGGWLGKFAFGKSASSAVLLDDSLCAARALQLNNTTRPVNINNGNTIRAHLGIASPERNYSSVDYTW